MLVTRLNHIRNWVGESFRLAINDVKVGWDYLRRSHLPLLVGFCVMIATFLAQLILSGWKDIWITSFIMSTVVVVANLISWVRQKKLMEAWAFIYRNSGVTLLFAFLVSAIAVPRADYLIYKMTLGGSAVNFGGFTKHLLAARHYFNESSYWLFVISLTAFLGLHLLFWIAFTQLGSATNSPLKQHAHFLLGVDQVYPPVNEFAWVVIGLVRVSFFAGIMGLVILAVANKTVAPWINHQIYKYIYDNEYHEPDLCKFKFSRDARIKRTDDGYWNVAIFDGRAFTFSGVVDCDKQKRIR
jgi:hypothetical protein